MKKIKLAKIISFVMFFALLSSSIIIKAQAVELPIYIFGFDLKLRNGVTNCTYYIDTSAINANYEIAINRAVSSWATQTMTNSTSARVNFSRVYSASSATIVFQVPTSFPTSVSNSRGYVMYYDGSTSVNVPGGNPQSSWTKCTVFMKSGLSLDPTGARRTACHEIGHCLGLKHATGVEQSIMYTYDNQPATNYGIYEPTADDVALIETLY